MKGEAEIGVARALMWRGAETRLSNHHDIEDVVQSSLIQKLADASINSFRCARDKAASFKRTQGRRRRTECAYMAMRGMKHARWIQDLVIARIDCEAALSQLTALERKAVHQRIQEGRTMYATGNGYSAFRYRLESARRKLRVLLASYEDYA